MNSALYLLNALALVALVSFHFYDQDQRSAEVQVATEQLVARPVARLAVMNSQNVQTSTRVSVEQGLVAPQMQMRTERFTF
ncbi:hypothetical protein [Pseudomonas sp. nanlin1]|uniref:hypothetical protein n=1 Tax=Pseudomonas sp. nanlin1 TaxID=3040605 RepID=UPI00388FFDEE